MTDRKDGYYWVRVRCSKYDRSTGKSTYYWDDPEVKLYRASTRCVAEGGWLEGSHELDKGEFEFLSDRLPEPVVP